MKLVSNISCESPKQNNFIRRASNIRKNLSKNETEDAESQCRAILNHLQQGKGITPMDALNLFGCFRLSARIWDLRANGYNIVTRSQIKDGKRFAKYYLE